MNTDCNCRTGILHGNTCYVIMVDVIQTLMCFENLSCFFLRQKFNTYTIRHYICRTSNVQAPVDVDAKIAAAPRMRWREFLTTIEFYGCNSATKTLTYGK